MSALTGIPDLIADETLFGGGTHENLDGQGLDVHIDFNIDERRMLHRRVNLLVVPEQGMGARAGVVRSSCIRIRGIRRPTR